MFRLLIMLIGIKLITHSYDATCEEILVFMPLPAKSHFRSFQPLFEELVKRGHNLTLVSGHSLSDKFQEKYKHINIKYLFPNLKINFAEMRKQNRLQNFIFIAEQIIEYDEYVLKDPQFRDLLTSKKYKFDCVIIEFFFMDVFAALGGHFNAPTVAVSSQSLLPYYSWHVGNPVTPSYIPNLFLPFTNKMSFTERSLNGIYTGLIGLYYEYIATFKHQKQMEKYFKFKDDEVPKIKNLIQNVSLILVNSHYAFGYPKPQLPMIIQTAGLHITESTPFPKNLENFLSNAVSGFIYVSLGSLIDPNDVVSLGETFVKGLGGLPERVVFKWNPNLISNVPENFFVQEWVPQISILRHPKCRLFITHGGLHSLIESVNFSVPLIGIPFFADQQHNMALVESLGIGKALPVDVEADLLLSTAKEVLSDSKYYENVNRQSKTFNDRLVSPLNAAVYWIEYIMRHKDTSHLKLASSDLMWFQYYLLDVCVLLFVTFLIILYIFYLSIKFGIFAFYNILYSLEYKSKKRLVKQEQKQK